MTLLISLHMLLGTLFLLQSAAQQQSDLSTTSTTTTDLPICRVRSVCIAQQNNGNDPGLLNYTTRNCFCDKLCKVYGDCCADVSNDDINEGTYDDLTQLASDLFSCDKYYGIESVHMINIIDRCPANWLDSEIKSKCHMEGPYDAMLFWPVSDSKHGRLYKNIYCSICHGLSQKQVLFWKADFQCDKATENFTTIDIKAMIDDGTFDRFCSKKYLPPTEGITYRECKEYVGKCDPGYPNPDDVDQCESPKGVSFVYGVIKTFKNKECAMCNYEDIWACASMWRSPEDNEPPPVVFYPLSLILDLNNGIGERRSLSKVGQTVISVNKTIETVKQCLENHVYDPFVAKCRKIGCGSGYELQNGKCTLYESKMDGSESTNLPCIRIMLNKTEYTMLSYDNVYVNSSDTILSSDEYEIGKDDTILICTNLTRNYTSRQTGPLIGFKFDTAQTVLSTIGLIISLIALAIHFIVYSVLPQLRNLAGKNLMCLVASLFTAQFLFLFGVGRSRYYSLCFSFAVVMHYAFLAAFCWMSVMSVDIFRTFSVKIKPTSTDKHKRDFTRYSVYAWLAPAVIASTAVILNFTASESHALWPGYAEGVCWITSRWALLTFFGIPVFLSVAVNTTLFSLTTASICKITKATKIVAKGADKHRLLLYAKLSTIMGLTWIFGFAATLADVRSLWYVFIIFNSLQGLFICITFVCNRKTIRMLKEKYGKAVKSMRPSTDATRTTLLSHSKSRSHSVETDHAIRVTKNI